MDSDRKGSTVLLIPPRAPRGGMWVLPVLYGALERLRPLLVDKESL
jgi:hypothetical protein